MDHDEMVKTAGAIEAALRRTFSEVDPMHTDPTGLPGLPAGALGTWRVRVEGNRVAVVWAADRVTVFPWWRPAGTPLVVARAVPGDAGRAAVTAVVDWALADDA